MYEVGLLVLLMFYGCRCACGRRVLRVLERLTAAAGNPQVVQSRSNKTPSSGKEKAAAKYYKRWLLSNVVINVSYILEVTGQETLYRYLTCQKKIP
ncbi:hypothetical protein HDV64DRAFT_248119 [Trichoderma sp. TUCIM 5745]